VLSKVLEPVVSKQLLSHRRLLPDLQSACRAHHSTETAVLKVLSDISIAVRHEIWRCWPYLIYRLLFDPVDQGILLRRLEISCGLYGVVLQCMVCVVCGSPYPVCSLQRRQVDPFDD